MSKGLKITLIVIAAIILASGLLGTGFVFGRVSRIGAWQLWPALTSSTTNNCPGYGVGPGMMYQQNERPYRIEQGRMTRSDGQEGMPYGMRQRNLPGGAGQPSQTQECPMWDDDDLPRQHPYCPYNNQ